MNMIKYPSETDVNKAICDNEPLLALISFDGKTVITSQIDEAVEHHICLLYTSSPHGGSKGCRRAFRIT